MHRQRGTLGDPRGQRRHVQSGADQEHRLRGFRGEFEGGHHVLKVGGDVIGVRSPGLNRHHRAVDRPHHCHRDGQPAGHGAGRVGVGLFNEQQGRAFVADRAPDRLSERAGGVQFGHHHDVTDVIGAQRLPQPPTVSVIGPRHTDRRQPVRALVNALPGAEKRGHHLLGRAGVPRIADRHVNDIAVERDTPTIGALDEHHPDSRGCHRHTKNDLHQASPLNLNRLPGSSPRGARPLPLRRAKVEIGP